MTLVEVIVVLVVLAILAAIVIPVFTGWIDKSREKACIANRKAAEKEYNTFDLINEGGGQSFESFLASNGEPLNKMCPGGGTCTVDEFLQGSDGAYCKITCSLHPES